MNTLSLIIKSFILSAQLQGGVMPQNSVTLFYEPHEIIQGRGSTTFYSDINFDLEIAERFHLTTGTTAYQWHIAKLHFSPMRADFIAGFYFDWKGFRMGYEHGCYHPIFPGFTQLPPWKVDAAVDRFYIEAKIRKRLFN